MHFLPRMRGGAAARLPQLRERTASPAEPEGGFGILMVHPLIERVKAGNTLSRAEADVVMEELLSGRVETPETVRLLAALNTRPYQAEELVGFAHAMRRNAAQVFAEGTTRPASMVDTCGTGGDASHTFNISTAAAFVAAAAGARVAKHGNRAASSKTGAADVLEALGVRIDLPLESSGRAICELGIGFLFAQTAHQSMRHAMPARKQIGTRTVFNLLGPLTNPAGTQSQVVGVFSAEVIDAMAAALVGLGVERAFVVHGAGGLDEVSLAGETLIAEVKNGAIHRYTVTPEDFGVARAPIEALRGGTAAENAALIRRIFSGEPGPHRDVVVANAAAALVAAGVAGNFRKASELAAEAIDCGAARDTLARLISLMGA
jgi:anthranilate phosphoribosyltransferase